jgi:hypothetical protein
MTLVLRSCPVAFAEGRICVTSSTRCCTGCLTDARAAAAAALRATERWALETSLANIWDIMLLRTIHYTR